MYWIFLQNQLLDERTWILEMLWLKLILRRKVQKRIQKPLYIVPYHSIWYFRAVEYFLGTREVTATASSISTY